jgi:hypothetical protein
MQIKGGRKEEIGESKDSHRARRRGIINGVYRAKGWRSVLF